MQLVERLNRSLKRKDLKKAYNIYLRMQARGYPQALLTTDQKILCINQ